MNVDLSKERRLMVLASPIIVIFIGFITAFTFSKLIQEWAWVPLTIVYWSSLGICLLFLKERKGLRIG